MSSSYILVGNKLLLVGGKPLATAAQPAQSTPVTGVALTQWFLNLASGYVTRFNIQTSYASGDTAANVPIVFTCTGGTPTLVEARVVDSNGNAVAGSDWTDITASVTKDASSTYLGYLNNVLQGIGYKRQVRINGLTATDTTPFNIGQTVTCEGQSNMRGTLDAGSGYVGGVSRDTAVRSTGLTERTWYETKGVASFFGMQGFVPAGYNGYSVGSYSLVGGGGLMMTRHLGDLLELKAGKKVGICLNPWAINASAMGVFMPTPKQIKMVVQNGTTSGNVGFSTPAGPYLANGDYRLAAWHQGESEQYPTRASRFNDLVNWCLGHIEHAALYGRPANKITLLFAQMGQANPTHMELLRAAVYDLIDYVKKNNLGWDVRVGWSCIDLDPQNAGDTLHFGPADQVRSNKRLTQAIGNALAPTMAPYGASGPSFPYVNGTVGSVPVYTGLTSRSGDVVTVTVQHNSGPGSKLIVANTANPITGWYANTAPDFSGTDLVVSNVTIADALAGKVQVTIKDSGGNSPTYPVYLKHMGGKWGTTQSMFPDESNMITDDFKYPSWADPSEQYTGLPLQATPDAIKVD